MSSPGAPPRSRLLPEISTRCTGCGRCVGACPPHVLWLDTVRWKKSAVLHDAAGCTGCRRCEVVCPFGAIRMRGRAAPAPEPAAGGVGPATAPAPAPA